MAVPPVAAVLCIYLAGPWVDRDGIVYKIAGGLMLAIGVGALGRDLAHQPRGQQGRRAPRFADIEHMDIDPTDDPR